MFGGGRFSSVLPSNDGARRPGSGGSSGGGVAAAGRGLAARGWAWGQEARQAQSAKLDLNTSATAGSGETEDEEATYEFVVGSRAVENGGGETSGRSWSAWGSRLAGAGSGAGLSG